MHRVDELHEKNLRITIGKYLESSSITIFEYHQYMEYYLHLIQNTPMISYSANRKLESGYRFENNNIVVPDAYMLDIH